MTFRDDVSGVAVWSFMNVHGVFTVYGCRFLQAIIAIIAIIEAYCCSCIQLSDY